MKKLVILILAACIMSASFQVFGAKSEYSVAAFSKTEGLGGVICFERSDFVTDSDKTNTLDAILVTKLPDNGALIFDGESVSAGDIINMDDLALLTYSADDVQDEALGDIYFRPVFSRSGTGKSDVKITLSISDKPNNSPVAINAEYATYTNVKLSGKLKVVDTDNDECSFEIVTAPKKGTLTLEGADFVYTPKQDKSGKDFFEFRATDCRSNKSAVAKVTVEIRKPASKESFSYSDMEYSPAHYAALYLREAGVMEGESFGGESFFYPDREVSRAQFVALISYAAEMSVPTVSVGTGLSDNEDIPEWARPYIAAAISCGVISGESSDDGNKVFRASDPITRAEAAAIIDRAVGLALDGREMTFDDSLDVPAWAAQSIVNTTAAGIVTVFEDNTVRASEYVTREDAALMLYKTVCYIQGKTNDTGFLAGLFD